MSQDPVYYLGQPVLEAHDYEKRQEWAGAILAPTASTQLDQNSMRAVTWSVPLKSGPSELRAVDWPFCSDGPRIKRMVEDSLVDGPSPDWAACFAHSTDARVLAKQKATQDFFLMRDRRISGGGVMFGKDSGDISSWRSLYDARND